jgi:hypothetical protein
MTNDASERVLADADALALLAFLVSSAEGCLKEPPLYGVFRLSTAAVKLAAAWAPHASAETAVMLRAMISRWGREAVLLGADTRLLKDYLQQSSLALARELERRDALERSP